MMQVQLLLLVPSTQEHYRRTIQSLLAFFWHYHCVTVIAWTNLRSWKWWYKGENLWWWWAKDKKNTQESAGLTHSNDSQRILLFLLLIFHGAIYYCRVYNTTQTISLVDYIYQILKSVLNKYGTLWFQTLLITGCHLGTSITEIMRRNQTHSPNLSLTVTQRYRRKYTKHQSFLYLSKTNF